MEEAFGSDLIPDQPMNFILCATLVTCNGANVVSTARHQATLAQRSEALSHIGHDGGQCTSLICEREPILGGPRDHVQIAGNRQVL